MLIVKENEILSKALSYLPTGLSEKIRSVLAKREDCPMGLSEIRIREGRFSSVVVSGESIPIERGLTKSEAEQLLDRLCGGSIYAYRDTLADGYVTIGLGIRVGIAAEAKFDDGAMVGICNPKSFIFRLPTAKSQVADKIYEHFRPRAKDGVGLLIFSKPSGGKTTALRALARLIGSGKKQLRVVAIDERGEFYDDFYSDCCVDILRGYKKSAGMELALRSLSPQVILVDEIVGDEAEALLRVGRGGIGIVASTHAGSIEELVSKSWVVELCQGGVFNCFAEISGEGSGFEVKFYDADVCLKETVTC